MTEYGEMQSEGFIRHIGPDKGGHCRLSIKELPNNQPPPTIKIRVFWYNVRMVKPKCPDEIDFEEYIREGESDKNGHWEVENAFSY